MNLSIIEKNIIALMRGNHLESHELEQLKQPVHGINVALAGRIPLTDLPHGMAENLTHGSIYLGTDKYPSMPIDMDPISTKRNGIDFVIHTLQGDIWLTPANEYDNDHPFHY